MKIPFDIQLNSLTLSNFRGFSEPIFIDFKDSNKLTVFIGVNGSGKTTILDSMAALLAFLIEKIAPIYELDKNQFSQYDINNQLKEEESKHELDLSLNGKPLQLKLNFKAKQSLKPAYLDTYSEVVEEGYMEINFYSYAEEVEGFDAFLQLIDSEITQNKTNTINLPVLVYYPIAKAILPSNNEQERVAISMYTTYKDAMKYNALDFATFKKWYVWQLNKKSDLLSAIEEAILGMLNDDENIFTEIDVDWEIPEGQLVLKKTDGFIYEKQLSSGEKSLISLVGDLARRLVYANPNRENPLEGNGIVLIDEVDLHLHPKWQRKVVTKLREIFPNIQFVVTTHSPLVLSNIWSKHIRSIENGKVYGVPDTFGHDDADDMLRIMGVQSQIREKIKAIHRLLRKNKIEEAKKIRENIITEGTFPPLLEIDLFIKRKERLANETH